MREALFQIEKELGIEELTKTDHKFLAVLASLSGGTENNVSLDDIRQDASITDVMARSLYRAFKTFQKRRYVGRSGSQRSGLYHFCEQAFD